jgi:hypothetical protein
MVEHVEPPDEVKKMAHTMLIGILDVCGQMLGEGESSGARQAMYLALCNAMIFLMSRLQPSDREIVAELLLMGVPQWPQAADKMNHLWSKPEPTQWH